MSHNAARIGIARESDIVAARQSGRNLAAEIGFSDGDLTVIATAISEIARNILQYARRGELELRAVEKGGNRGILVIGRDNGPGIADIEAAMRDGFSTGNGLGLGLPGARRLMHDFEVVSEAGKGTTVTMRKWLRG
jgi:serine/threonine-protein kinase RsbT